MPAIDDLSLNNGAATPVAKTFDVSTTDGQTSKWLEKSAGISIGYSQLTYTVRMAKTPAGADVVEISLRKPTLSTADGVSTVAYSSLATVRFNFAQQETDSSKKDLVAFVTNFLADADVKAAIPALDPFY